MTTIVYIDPTIALEAGKAYMILLHYSKQRALKTKPSLADAIVYAIAKTLAKILTGDEHFKDLDITIWG